MSGAPRKQLPDGVKPAGPGARERVFKRMLYDSGFVASKALYGAVSAVKEAGADLGEHLEQQGLITPGQLARLRERTDWRFATCPARQCGKQWELGRLPDEDRIACPRCSEPIELPERTLTEGRLMILKPQKIKNMILGKLALKKGFVTRAQLDECFEIHARSTRNKQLAQVFIDQGYLPGERVGELLTEHNAIVESMEGYFRRLVKEIEQIDKLVARGLVGTDEMNQAIEQQSRGMAQGQTPELLELLVQRGSLSAEQRKMIQEGRVERMVTCPKCSALYLVRNLDEQRKFLCKNCGELVGGESDGPRVAEERPALSDTSGVAPLPAAAGESSEAITVQPHATAEDSSIVELTPIGEDGEIDPALPEGWDEEQVAAEQQPVAGEAIDEPDAADFLDDDFMVSDHLEPMDQETLAQYREQLAAESDAAETPALGPEDSVEDLEVVDEPATEEMQAEIERLTAELEQQKAKLAALKKKQPGRE